MYNRFHLDKLFTKCIEIGCAKRLGKQAVHLGGATQLLFGIKGKRWGEIGNEHWVSPLAEERPQGFEKIEGGCYW